MGHLGKILGALFLLLSGLPAFAQNQQYAFRVAFTDKNETPFTFTNPAAYLSSRAIARRTKYNIAIDSTDLPVNQVYIDSVLHVTEGILHLKSKWQNHCVILLSDSSKILELQNISFIKSIKQVAYYFNGLHQQATAVETGGGSGNMGTNGPQPSTINENFYGAAWPQIHMCNGESLHQFNKMGQGKLIAVIDLGFDGVDIATVFDSMRNRGRLTDAWNYIFDTAQVTGNSDHGTKVLSTMAAYAPEVYVGTAPEASYALYVTDDENTEQSIEEDNWLAAAERADSIGADVISTSVGYNEFENPDDSYTYADLDGHTTIVARAANTAHVKGIMVLASAGNEGITSWQHILTPGDADSIMTVGSVNALKQSSSFSGLGPNASGLQKPNVSAQGGAVSVITSSGMIGVSSGASISTPVLAGLTACIMQAAPAMPPRQVRRYIEFVSDSFTTPNLKRGYGVPDLQRLLEIIDVKDITKNKTDDFRIYPNPTTDEVYIAVKSADRTDIVVSCYDLQGKRIYQQHMQAGNGRTGKIDMRAFPAGTYFIRISSDKGYKVEKVIKR